MIIDSFLFFQELDLLEIRLEYLYPLVDKFLIVEAKQTFTGLRKEFLFEKNIKRYSRFIDKIIYHKIEDIHYDNDHLIDFLEYSNNEVQRFIALLIKKHNHYFKENLSHLLDSYHRECIHILLKKESKGEDIILLSDLDEIPDFRTLEKIKKSNQIEDIMVFVQKEFQYFLNNYANSDWFGSIVAPYRLIKYQSLNELRINSKKFPIISNYGYHFTSVGDVESIKRKIESWGHQEFNHRLVKDNLKKNILSGKDIFYRLNKRENKCINLYQSKLIDKRMLKIITNYSLLILDRRKYNFFSNINYIFNFINFNFIRISKNPKLFIKKFLSFIFKKTWKK